MILRDLVKRRAIECGFDLVGITLLPVAQGPEFARRWLQEGFGGEMHYLRNPKREDPRLVLPSAKSAILVGLVYNTSLPYSTESAGMETAGTQGREAGQPARPLDGPRAWISRYAWGRDYHSVMRERLERLREALVTLAPGAETRVYVDTGPVNERALARSSGIGWMGKNTLIINQQKGSWFFLGVVLTNLELAPDGPAPDRCGSCTRCLDACPTGALVRPYVMDASRCIAYLTIELKGAIPEKLRPAVGRNVFGCDICQDVCPWNSTSPRQDETRLTHQQAATTEIPEFQPLRLTIPHPAGQGSNGFGDSFSLFNPSLENLTALTAEDFQTAFRNCPIKRAKYRGWLRNLCVAIGNSGDDRFVPWLRRLLHYPDALVQGHALWALRRVEANHSAVECSRGSAEPPVRDN